MRAGRDQQQGLSSSPSSMELRWNDNADYSSFAAGDLRSTYRLGDVFVLWYLVEQNVRWSFEHLVGYYALRYPNTIAHLYLLEVAAEANNSSVISSSGRTYSSSQLVGMMRNLDALLRVLDGIDQQQDEVEATSYRRARKNELVVHVRLGDVLTSECCADLNATIQEQWDRPEGFINKDEWIKTNYNKREYQELLERIPAQELDQIDKCVIVGADRITDSAKDYRNRQYIELVKSLLEQAVGCDVSFFDSPNPDKALLFMASAHRIVVGMGGFGQIAAACVRARRGREHAIYDKFNGKVASWKDERFDNQKRNIYRNEYINWSRVKYERKHSEKDI